MGSSWARAWGGGTQRGWREDAVGWGAVRPVRQVPTALQAEGQVGAWEAALDPPKHLSGAVQFLGHLPPRPLPPVVQTLTYKEAPTPWPLARDLAFFVNTRRPYPTPRLSELSLLPPRTPRLSELSPFPPAGPEQQPARLR